MSIFHFARYVTFLMTLLLLASSSLATDVLCGGDELNSITSANGLYRFQKRSDGNLVLTRTTDPDGNFLWASYTTGMNNSMAVMQTDGNFVTYWFGKAYWCTNTHQHPGSRLVIQDDGNLVIYTLLNRAIWATNTAHFTPDPVTVSGDTLYGGNELGSITSASGLYRFQVNSDGYLVLFRTTDSSDRPLWRVGLGTGDSIFVMKTNGDFVEYSHGHIYWHTNTSQYPGSRLVIQDDGNLVIYTPSNQPVWATNTDLLTLRIRAEENRKKDLEESEDIFISLLLVVFSILLCLR